MKTPYKYDLFISYATQNAEVADFLVKKIEEKGFRCFIAPRDMPTGEDYAKSIIGAISNSLAVLLVFSEDSDKSGYVLREINSAVSRNKTIIPIKIEDFLPSEAMEFYLGVTQWLNAFPKIVDVHVDTIIKILKGIMGKTCDESSNSDIIVGPSILKISEIGKINFDYAKLVMKEIELDYLCVPINKFEMNDDIEGAFDDWENCVKEYEEDTSAILVKNNEMIGYCDFYPVTDEAYAKLINGEVIMRESMIDLFSLGGEFNAYIAMIAVNPDYSSQEHYLMLLDWAVRHLADWESRDILINNIGISVYSDMLEKFIIKFGFEYVGLNPAKGKIYQTSYKKLKENTFVKKRYALN